MMNSNPHYYPAQDTSGQEALVHAILALAFEQRTCTLVAYMAVNPDALVTDAVDVTVRERLGLAPDPMKVNRG